MQGKIRKSKRSAVHKNVKTSKGPLLMRVKAIKMDNKKPLFAQQRGAFLVIATRLQAAL